MINAPARANEETLIPNNPSSVAPKNKNNNMMTAAEIVAIPALIFNPSRFILINTGREPIISITENKISVTDRIAVMFIKSIY